MLIYAYVNCAYSSLFASYCTHLNAFNLSTFKLNIKVYRDRLSGNSRDGNSAIAWYLQPLPGTRPSYSVSKPVQLKRFV